MTYKEESIFQELQRASDWNSLDAWKEAFRAYPWQFEKLFGMIADLREDMAKIKAVNEGSPWVEWECPKCQTRNLAVRVVCSNCKFER